jgi:hypothetical protein
VGIGISLGVVFAVVVLLCFAVTFGVFFVTWLRLGRRVRSWQRLHGEVDANFKTVMSMEDWRRYHAGLPPAPKSGGRLLTTRHLAWSIWFALGLAFLVFAFTHGWMDK